MGDAWWPGPYRFRPDGPGVEAYFRAIEGEIERGYSVAERARSLGIDPETRPEIPRAQDMASRVEKLLAHLGIDGIADEIRALARTMSPPVLAP